MIMKLRNEPYAPKWEQEEEKKIDDCDKLTSSSFYTLLHYPIASSPCPVFSSAIYSQTL
jgi:hypothetical protein